MKRHFKAPSKTIFCILVARKAIWPIFSIQNKFIIKPHIKCVDIEVKFIKVIKLRSYFQILCYFRCCCGKFSHIKFVSAKHITSRWLSVKIIETRINLHSINWRIFDISAKIYKPPIFAKRLITIRIAILFCVTVYKGHTSILYVTAYSHLFIRLIRNIK